MVWKRRIPVLAVVLCQLLPLMNLRAGEVDSEIPIAVNRISDRVLIARLEGVPQATNVIALKTAQGIAVIDAEASPTFARAIRQRIAREFGCDDFAILINTHDHGDHTYGNQVFAGAEIIGQENVTEEMKKSEEKRARTIKQLQAGVAAMRAAYGQMDANSEAAKSMAKRISFYDQMQEGLDINFALTTPNMTFSDSMDINLGDLTLHLTYFGYAHSRSDILIYCPEEQLLATGDLFYAGDDLYIDSERLPFLPRWMANLKNVVNQKENIAAIVPGHGDLLPMADLAAQRDTLKQRETEFSGRESAFFAFKKDVDEVGLDKALTHLKKMRKQPKKYFVLHPELDSYAYKMMLDGRLDEALKIFQGLAELFPDNYIAFDSLGEAFSRKGDKERAIENFEKSLELNPENQNAKDRLEELQG